MPLRSDFKGAPVDYMQERLEHIRKRAVDGRGYTGRQLHEAIELQARLAIQKRFGDEPFTIGQADAHAAIEAESAVADARERGNVNEQSMAFLRTATYNAMRPWFRQISRERAR